MKINGIAIDGQPTEALKVSMLNMYLGENGSPKYTQSQLKGKNKASLLEELMPVYEAALAAHEAKPKRQVREGAAKGGAKSHESNGKKSAQSKLCHARADLLSGKKTPEQITELWHGDSWLQRLTTLDDLLNIKERPGSGNHGTKKRSNVDHVNQEALNVMLAAGERLLDDGYILADVAPNYLTSGDTRDHEGYDNDNALGEPADESAPMHIDGGELFEDFE